MPVTLIAVVDNPKPLLILVGRGSLFDRLFDCFFGIREPADR